MGSSKLFKRDWKRVFLLALVLANVFVWHAVAERSPSKYLSVYFLDVGQGDAIFINTPNHGRVLIDGGKNAQVLHGIGKVVPFGDRRIDVVLGTHPDLDHIGGLPEVVSRYKVGLYLWPGVVTNKSIDQELWQRLEEREVPNLVVQRGMMVNFGDGVRLIILFPNQDVSGWNENDASIVAKLVYGEHSFMLTGDSPLRIENVMLNMNKEILASTVLKAGHHGSRTSTSLPFAEAVSPEYAVIQAGKNNSYGHPHKEVLDNLASVGALVLNNADLGTIHFRTDGENLKIK